MQYGFTALYLATHNILDNTQRPFLLDKRAEIDRADPVWS